MLPFSIMLDRHLLRDPRQRYTTAYIIIGILL